MSIEYCFSFCLKNYFLKKKNKLDKNKNIYFFSRFLFFVFFFFFKSNLVIKVGFKRFVLAAFKNTRDRCPRRFACFAEVVLRNRQAFALLARRRTSANPHVHFAHRVEDEYVVGVEQVAFDRTARHLFGSELASGIADFQQFLLASLRIRFWRVLRNRVGFAAQHIPWEVTVAAFSGHDHLCFASTFIIDGTSQSCGFVFLKDTSIFASPLINFQTLVQNEHIVAVQRRRFQRHFHSGNVFARAFDVQQTSTIRLWLNVTKASVDATGLNGDAVREQFQKCFRFVTLHFTILNWCTAKNVIQFHCFVSSSTGFILSGVSTEPKVGIVQQSITAFLFVRVQNDVRITREEFAILLFWP
mmetsp:Transcript_22874/g.38881  ORF Transcript_22874/g.38881 Transcript_22874/m.38881 type:complete len:357 (+) Transcript_22874:128-1198(+)